MGKDSELFKAAKTGNNAFIERVFASYLKRASPQAGGGVTSSGSHGSHGFGSIRHKTHPNIQDESGYTLLHHATLQGQKDTVSLLLKCGASTTMADSSGSCSLHLAAWKGDLEIVRILVTQGPSRANVNQLNDQEDSALHLASQYGYSDIVEFLLQRHAEPLQRNIKGETPLDLAAQYGHLDTVHLLISTAPEILQLQRVDFSPLHLAARNGHTVVALSLINAGLCVNTVCERGSALHEAAMCGKTDVVQLLLDKGIDLDLKDSNGKTVLNLLQDYTAPRAKDIEKMIQDHVTNKSQRAGSSPSSPGQDQPCRVIAVAKANVNTVMEEGSALAFKTGDNIVVQGRRGPDVFIGTAHGRKGSFLVQDATFYKDKGGVLVETDHTHLFTDDISPVGSLASAPNVPEGAVKITVTNKAPYEHVPGFPSPSPPTPTSTIAIATNQPRPLSTIAPTHPEQGTPLGDETGPLSRTWSEPHRKNLSAKLPGKEARMSALVERSDSRRLSKKEKKFHLSKDDGSYAELKPVNPHEAKKEFGDTLKLNPVGPAFQSAAAAQSGAEPASDGDHMTIAHNVVNGEGEKSHPQFQGSYYVLEVGNFDPVDDATVVSPPTSGNSLATPTAELPAGYYMLDLENMDKDDKSSKVNKDETNRVSMYENVAPSSGRGSKVGTPEPNLSPTHHATVNGTTPPPLSQTPPTSDQGVTVYENVIISALGVPEPIVPVEHPYSVPPPSATVMSSGREPPRPPRADGRCSWVGPVEDEGGYTLVDETTRKMLGPGGVVVNARVPDCYEQHKIKSNEDAQPPSSSDDGHVTSPKRNNARRREEAYEVINVGGAKSQSTSVPKVRVNGINGSLGEEGLTHERGAAVKGKLGEEGLMYEGGATVKGTNIIDNTGDNPFAGLVMSASRQLEESLPLLGTSPNSLGAREEEEERRGEMKEKFRGRVDTVWDDVRMEKEWTQIDTLLRDMSLPEGEASPVNGSPVKKQPTDDIYQWLHGHQLSGYSSVLESSGFDRKEFLGGGILAMDDLVDLGISDDGDRYNIMAAVSLLPDPPKVGHAQSIAEWLQLLQLSQLERKFQGYTLKRVSNFWDIELVSVVGIELLGYRKRLQYGIGELRRVHPEWAEKTTPTQASPTKPEAVPKIPPKKRRAMQATGRATPTDRATPTGGPTHAQLLREDMSELSVRPPSAAMGVAGKKARSLSTESWKHPHSALTEGCNYHIQYLGSLIVKRLHGQQSAEEACLKLRHSMERVKLIPDIILSISWKGVQFADSSSKNVVSTHAIRDISYCSADIEDKRVFAYITRDRQANLNYSHVFKAPTQAMADEIRMTIAQAFEICYQKVMKAKRLSQEKRTSGGSPITSPVH